MNIHFPLLVEGASSSTEGVLVEHLNSPYYGQHLLLQLCMLKMKMKMMKMKMNLFGYTYKIYDIGYKTEMMSKECNAGDPLETPGGLYRGPPSNGLYNI